MARIVAAWSGRSATFVSACLLIAVWALTGPLFHYSDTWQLVINTLTTVVTFLMVFLIQNTQNRDSAAVQLKLDELIRATKGAHNAAIAFEEMEQDQLEELRKQYEQLASNAQFELDKLKRPTVVAAAPGKGQRKRMDGRSVQKAASR